MFLNRRSFFIISIFLLTLAACRISKQRVHEPIEVTIIQLNDVYEIAPLDGGRYGGMARVAYVIREEERKNPNTLAILSGDFLSPSLLGTLKYRGKRISGLHMVEVMNAAGIDLVTFGNHEFDLKRDELQERIYQSAFDYVSANVFQKIGNDTLPFQEMENGRITDIPAFRIIPFENKRGEAANLGFFGVTLPFTKKDYVVYLPVDRKMREMVDSLKETDAIIALTHLDFRDDTMYARQFPQINLIAGGHDHEHMYFNINGSIVAKADANARTIYIHRITIHPNGKVDIHSELKAIDPSVPEDSLTIKVVDKWLALQDSIFKRMNVNPDEVLMMASPEGLDGREAIIRNQPTNLGRMIAKAMLFAIPEADAAILNSGSVRVDDVLKGEITQYDVLRTLPFGGPIYAVKMKGALLEKVLNVGRKNKGTGGFLQWANIEVDSRRNVWLLKGKAIQADSVYTVAMPAFLLTGMETNLSFLTPENPDILDIRKPKEGETLRKDIRYAVMAYMRALSERK